MRRSLVLFGIVLLGTAGVWVHAAQQPATAPPAQAFNPANFTGTVTPHSTADIRMNRYHFDPGARTKWHSHSGGQVMLVEEGVTHHQNKGGPVMELRANEAYYVQPGVVHWHGAAADSSTVQFNTTRGDITWLEEVSEADYKAKAKR